MSYEHVKNYRQRQKENIVYVMGEKCACCGYDRCKQALELHHLDPLQKDFTIAQNTNRAWETVCKELPKTIMVCANCHREIHAGIIDNNLLKSNFNESRANEIGLQLKETKEKKVSYCKDCGREITFGAVRCVECHSLNKRAVERPERNQLKQDIRTMSMTNVGKKYGVTDNAVRKWCDSMDLPRKVSDIKSYSDEEWEKI